jgi:prepilin-type N-terminal cleavage/methylation domain-containing protein
MHVKRADAGFTLIELLVAIVILGIISVPLANVVIGYLRNSDAPAARMSESHDAQISAAYFSRDVASIGVRATASPYALTQSVDKTNPGAWSYPCAIVGSTPVVQFAWDDFSSAMPVRVAYVVAGGGTELHRLACSGSATPTSNVVLAHDLDPANPPIISCSPTCTAPPAVPATVTLALTIKDTRNRGLAYTISLSGQRRQT